MVPAIGIADLPIGGGGLGVGVGGVNDVITNDGSLNINLLIEQNDNNSSFMVVNQNAEQIGVVYNNTNSVSDNSVESDNNDVVGQISTNQPPATITTYVKSTNGLFPSPMGKSAKLSQISRIKTKFRFLGKFMAKAVMDSRMVSFFFKFFFQI